MGKSGKILLGILGAIVVAGSLWVVLNPESNDGSGTPMVVVVPVPTALADADPELVRMIDKHVATVQQDLRNYMAWATLGQVYVANMEYDIAADCLEQSVDLNPQCSKCWYILSMAYAGSQDVDDAIDAMKRAIEIDSGYSPAYWRLGDLLMERGNLDDAEMAYSRARTVNKDDPAAWFGLAKLQLKKGNHDDAILLLEEVLSKTGMNLAYGHQLLAQAYQRAGRTEDAARAIRRAGGEAQPWIDPLAAETLGYQRGATWAVQTAQALIKEGRTDEAVGLLYDELARKPDDAPILNNLGAALIAQRRYEKAAGILHRALAARPKYDEAHFNLALCAFLQLDDPDFSQKQRSILEQAALDHLDQALEINPSYALARGLKGQIAERNGDRQAALDAYMRAAETSTGDGRWSFQAGRILNELHRFAEAIDPLSDAIALSPNNGYAQLEMIRALIYTSQHEQAQAILDALRTREGAEELAKEAQRLFDEQAAGPLNRPST